MTIKREYTIALLAAAGITLLVFGVNFLKGIDLLQRRNIFHVVYDDVSGITEASPVFYNGFKVGQVVKTALVPATGRIAIGFQLNEHGLRLPADSRVRIYSADLFTRALQLLPGSSATLAQAGDTLQGESQLSLTDAVGEQIDPLKRKAEAMLVNIDSVLTALQRVLNDTAIGDIDASFASVRSTLASLDRTAKRIDELVGTEATTIQATLANLEQVSAALAAHSTEMSRILTNLDTLTTALADGRIDRLIAGLAASSEKLKDLTTRLERGEGTLGALMTNDTLYHNLKDASHELDLLLEDLRVNPNRYFSVFGKKDRLPRLSDADIQRIKQALEQDKRLKP